MQGSSASWSEPAVQEELAGLLVSREGERLEFKEAKENFHFETLVKYCAALANEGGGRMVLGISDRVPRRVVGTRAFDVVEKTKAGILQRLHLRVEADEWAMPEGRVLVFRVPPHPLGLPISFQGAYWMRSGEELVPMTPDLLRRIFDEVSPDWSAEVCSRATQQDLSPQAIAQFRSLWFRKSGRADLAHLPDDQLLRDAELLVAEGVTWAALVLLGTRQALGRHLAQAEIVFEYKSSEKTGPAEHREEFREGFLLHHDALWELVNRRNPRHSFQDGLFMRDIAAFNEGAVREALLNAVSHRDYRLAGSVFVRQFPDRLEIASPGGFPRGITPENIIDRQFPRNRRIAEALARCGFVERSGQGANRIFESCIRESKPLPDFSQSDDWQVSLVLQGEVRDPGFVRFLEQVSQEFGEAVQTHDFLVLDLVHREQKVPDPLAERLPKLRTLGVLESVGRGRGQRWLLARRFHEFLGSAGTYTLRRGLDQETNKALLLQHLRDSGSLGAPMAELQDVLPSLSRTQIKDLLTELRDHERVELRGRNKGARWFENQIQAEVRPNPPLESRNPRNFEDLKSISDPYPEPNGGGTSRPAPP